jgi:penicillin-binding protein 2
MLGLGQKTGVDLPQEVSGVMPSEQWKIRNFKQKWYAGETISVGIGQGAVATTPIQLARAIGAITSDGVLVRPHIAFPDQFPPNFKQVALYNDKGHVEIDEQNWQTITDAMANVVSPIGTAGSAHLPGIDFAGKTGSAQTVSNQLKAKMSAKEKSEYKDNGWFVGVTPRRNPQLVVACLFEGGEHGALAARVAAKVVAAYVEKQRRIQMNVAKANAPGNKQAEVAAVWHDGDAQNPDKLQAGRFNVPTNGSVKPVAAAPGVAQPSIRPGALEVSESHTEMAQPDTEAQAPAATKPPDIQDKPAETPDNKKKVPSSSPPAAPPAVAVPRRQQ